MQNYFHLGDMKFENHLGDIILFNKPMVLWLE